MIWQTCSKVAVVVFPKTSKGQISLHCVSLIWNPHISKLKQHAKFKLGSMRWEHLPGDTQPADRNCWHILFPSFSSQLCYEPLGTRCGAHASQGTPPLCCHVNWHRSDHRQAVWHDSLPVTLGVLGRFLSNLSNLPPSLPPHSDQGTHGLYLESAVSLTSVSDLYWAGSWRETS